MHTIGCIHITNPSHASHHLSRAPVQAHIAFDVRLEAAQARHVRVGHHWLLLPPPPPLFLGPPSSENGAGGALCLCRLGVMMMMTKKRAVSCDGGKSSFGPLPLTAPRAATTTGKLHTQAATAQHRDRWDERGPPTRHASS